MTSQRRRPWSHRVYGLLLHAYPADFRSEYGPEMLSMFAALRERSRSAGALAGVSLWLSIVADLLKTAPREHAANVNERSTRRHAAGGYRPPYRMATLAALAVWCLYVATLAPTTGFWDAGEYITVAHILGIPHPPGNPLFVILGWTWNQLLGPLDLPVAVSINLLSATLSAAAHGFWFLIIHRALTRATNDQIFPRVGAGAAVLLSATAFTVWNQSNVNEKVYTVSFLTIALVSWLAIRWRDTGARPTGLLLLVFLIALSATNHLMGVLVAPALLLFVFMVDRRAFLRPRLWAAATLLVAIALSVHFFLPLRAQQRPIIAEAEPSCESFVSAVQSIYSLGRTGCEALSSSLTREQYGKPAISLDPTTYPQLEDPRGPGLVASQFANYAQYFNWQWARSVGGRDPLFGGGRVLLTLLIVALGLLGMRTYWRADRVSAAYLITLFLTLSAGLVVYLNFKYGFAIGWSRFPQPEMHEVRERDYFFLIGFSVWGLWAGVGVAALWQRFAAVLAPHFKRAHLAAAPVLCLASFPLALNWSWASRADDFTARDWAYNILIGVEPYGVLFTNGDNDTFPLWYLQEVEGIRRDVTVMVTSYLNTPWYVKQLRDLTQPCPPGIQAADDPTRIICQRPFRREDLPQSLIAAGAAETVRAPTSSAVPLNDAQIEQISASAFVTRERMTYSAGNLQPTIEAGTPMLPADTFVAAIIQATLGHRPVHFMASSPALAKLGLTSYSIRQGLTMRINNGPVAESFADGIIKLSATPFIAAGGAYVDLPRTETLVSQAFEVRGRVMKADSPWVDRATLSVPLQYASVHYAAAEAYLRTGDEQLADRHIQQGRWWQNFAR